MRCSKDSRKSPAIRDFYIENELQDCLDSGSKVWVVGDIHGHLNTFRALIHRMNLGTNDRVVLLGDMIDRGPDSAGVIKYVRENPKLIAIKGNHEQMATKSLVNQNIELDHVWLAKGGSSTWGSYIVNAQGDLHVAKLRFADDCAWMADLPSHIILNEWRLVHAGYKPGMDLESHDEKTLLWIRKAFYNYKEIIDPKRCILFGHTPTTKFGKPGSIANSKIILEDGRPSWKGLDTCAYNSEHPYLVAFELNSSTTIRQKTLQSERWWLRTEKREAPVSEYFGLAELRRRATKSIASKEKARRRLNMAGVSTCVSGPVSLRIVSRKLSLVEAKFTESGSNLHESLHNHP